MKKFIKRIKNNKILSILTILIVGVSFLLVTRITYAYLAPVIGDSKAVDIEGSADLVDDFKLELGSALDINATPTTLPENGSNYVKSTTAVAKLRANSTNNSVSKNYYIYLNIKTNTFEYIKDDTPEIILTITDPTGDEVTSLGDLTYGTYSGVSGFDVTTTTGLLTIANNYAISSSSSATYTEQEWTITLTYLNNTYDQSSNYGKSMTTELSLQKEPEDTSYHATCNDNTLACYVAKKYTGTQGSNGLYLHNGTIKSGETVIDANDNSYRYAGANPDNYVCFGSTETTCPNDNLYRIIGVFDSKVKLIKADYANGNLLGTTGAYYSSNTYSASNYSNYNGSLTTINRYYWAGASNSSNVWSESSLNTINLNGTYLSSFGDSWSNMIAETTWEVGGNTETNLAYSKIYTIYQNELVSPAANTTESKKIGLMYISDYGYAASQTYWTYYGYDSNGTWSSDYTVWNGNDYSAATSNNWLYMGVPEWTITRRSDKTNYAFDITDTGYVFDGRVDNNYYFAVRPAFYLNSTVTRSSGSGTSTDPYRVN